MIRLTIIATCAYALHLTANSFTMTSPNLCGSQTQYSFEISGTRSSITPSCVDNTRVINTQDNGRITYFSSQQGNSNWGTLYVFDATDSGKQAFSITTQETGSAQYIVRDGQNASIVLAQIDASDIGADRLNIRGSDSRILATAYRHFLTASDPGCANTQWNIDNSGNLPSPVLWYLVSLVSNANFQCSRAPSTVTECSTGWIPIIAGSLGGVVLGGLGTLAVLRKYPSIVKPVYTEMNSVQ